MFHVIVVIIFMCTHIYHWQTKQNTQWQQVQYKNMDNLIEIVEIIYSVNQPPHNMPILQ